MDNKTKKGHMNLSSSDTLRKWERENSLLSEASDFPFEVLILKFRVIVTADVGVIEGVV